MIKSQVICKWVNLQGVRNFNIWADYLVKSKDAVNQNAINIVGDLQPNSVIVEIECDAEKLALIDADDEYYIMWSVDNG